jgi:hypothetical protein
MTENGLEIFNELKAQVTDLVQPVLSAKIVDASTKELAHDAARRVKSLEKLVEDRRKELVAPLNARVKMINDYAKKIVAPLAGAESHLRQELVGWERKLEQERMAEQRRLREIEEAEKKKIADQLAKDRVAAEMFGTTFDENKAVVRNAEVEMNAAIAKQQISQNKVSGTRKTWKFEVVESEKVPREFLVVDDSAIRKAVQAGAREIAGVRIFEEIVIAIR